MEMSGLPGQARLVDSVTVVPDGASLSEVTH